MQNAGKDGLAEETQQPLRSQQQDNQPKQGNLLLNNLGATLSPGQVPRVKVELTAYQNKNAGGYGKNGQDNAQTTHRNESGQSRKNEPDGQ